MGYYINEDSKGKSLGSGFAEKLKSLKNDGAIPTTGDKFEKNLIVVLDNGHFAAAGYAYNEDEFKVFNYPDPRPKLWLVYEHAPKLSGYEK